MRTRRASHNEVAVDDELARVEHRRLTVSSTAEKAPGDPSHPAPIPFPSAAATKSQPAIR